jgi:hypothetical protein
MKGVIPCFVRWARCADTRDFYPSLVTVVGPVQNMFFLIVHYFILFFPIAQHAGHAVVLGHLSLNVCLCQLMNYVNRNVISYAFPVLCQVRISNKLQASLRLRATAMD